MRFKRKRKPRKQPTRITRRSFMQAASALIGGAWLVKGVPRADKLQGKPGRYMGDITLLGIPAGCNVALVTQKQETGKNELLWLREKTPTAPSKVRIPGSVVTKEWKDQTLLVRCRGREPLGVKRYQPFELAITPDRKPRVVRIVMAEDFMYTSARQKLEQEQKLEKVRRAVKASPWLRQPWHRVT